MCRGVRWTEVDNSSLGELDGERLIKLVVGSEVERGGVGSDFRN